MGWRSLYRGWMAFAQRLHKVVVSVLFGACYLLLVPVFFVVVRALDPLRLRKHTAKTYWVKRPNPVLDPKSLDRMG